MSDCRAGRRSMQTFRKLAMITPSTVKVAIPIASILPYILDGFGGIVKWVNGMIYYPTYSIPHPTILR